MISTWIFKIKEKNIWRVIIKYFISYIYLFIWRFILNFKGSLLYFFWFKKRRDLFKLKNDFLIVKNDKELKELSNILYKNCLKFDLDQLKEKMLNGTLLSNNQSNTGKKTYTIDLYDKLNLEVKKKIIDFINFFFTIFFSNSICKWTSRHLEYWWWLKKRKNRI